MKIKCFVFMALMLCLGAFMFPAAAHASDNTSPIAVTAKAEGDVLRIEASGGVTGVEAIFINGERFNFRVDGALTVDLLAFHDSEIISVYAVDFAGNMSNVVGVINPKYIGLQQTQPEPPQGAIPVTPSQSNPFTPAGQASVLDNAHNDDEKEFFTFTTPAGNVFFLIVDRQRGTDNVYFLNAVTEQDLIALADQSGAQISGGGGIPVSTAPQNPGAQLPDDTEPENETPPATDKDGGGNGTMIFLLVAVAIAGGVGYYFKIVRPKQQGGGYDDEDEDEEDIGEEMEFEDDPGEADDEESDDDYYNTDEDEPEVEDDGL